MPCARPSSRGSPADAVRPAVRDPRRGDPPPTAGPIRRPAGSGGHHVGVRGRVAKEKGGGIRAARGPCVRSRSRRAVRAADHAAPRRAARGGRRAAVVRERRARRRSRGSRTDSAGAVVGDRPEVGVWSRRRRERVAPVRVSPEFAGGVPAPWATGPDRTASWGTGGGHSGQVSRVRRSRAPTGHRGCAGDGPDAVVHDPRFPTSPEEPRRDSGTAGEEAAHVPAVRRGRPDAPARTAPRPGVAAGWGLPRPGRTHAAPVRLSVPSPGPRSAWRARARPG
ncbi:hypothetical protein FHX40_3290 [Thermopolyspora flexuosa]|jgi:hypothetical protein|uniref:Uncharacterized protein n=1 Tax=Thermopolyspora flexuosa TaxID=103836 RepID=A0A543J139_9ACTN|nr:hypothetical protein FHX40_3290 [Thermopolyspora flexuosa]